MSLRIFTPTTRSRASASIALSCVLALDGGTYAQTTDTPAANESFEAVFDVGIVVRPQAGQYGVTELMVAVSAGDAARVRELIGSGADVNAADHSGTTPLIAAAASREPEIVNLLLAAGADPDLLDHRGKSALAVAIQYRSSEAALALLRHGADPNYRLPADHPGARLSILERAAVTGELAVVSALIDAGIDLTATGPAALNAALWKGHEDVAATLIHRGVDVNAQAYDIHAAQYLEPGEHPLQTAAKIGLVRSAELLLREGADVHAADRKGQTALTYAAGQGHLHIAKLLLNHGAAVAAADLSAALGAGHGELARLLAPSLAVAGLSPAEFDSLVMLADATGEDEIIARLFEAESLLRKPRNAPLFLFARRDDEDCRLSLWTPQQQSRVVVYTEPGPCTSRFYASAERGVLIVASGEHARIVTLQGPANSHSVALPLAMMARDAAALEHRVNAAYGQPMGRLNPAIAMLGFLEDGELALVTHAYGPADETYGVAYAHDGHAWRQIDEKDCHRFDVCLFPQVRGRPLDARPAELAAWHPEVRKNPHFRSKVELAPPFEDYTQWHGSVTFEIDGSMAVVHYRKEESGHCFDDCVYTNGLGLQLADKPEIPLATRAGNNAIVGRYALVPAATSRDSVLIDLATGDSVFGDLQVAGWVY